MARTVRDDPQPERPDDLLGQMLGEYRVTGFIGAGGMGDVFAGFQPVIGKRVAIKVLKRELASNPTEARRFLSEAQAVNRIGHRGIIDIFTFGVTPDGRQYFVMEYLPGVSLAEHLRGSEGLPLQDVVRLLDELLAALDASHGAGVVHRDLKPSNIFLATQPDGTAFVKVLDFGIARVTGRAPRPGQTRPSQVLGTPRYMSPEQSLGEGVGPKSDLYALGIVAFEMLTGRAPFEQQAFIELMNAHLNTPPPAPSSLRGDVPLELDQLVLRLLEKEPERRIDATAARAELKRIKRVLDLDASRLVRMPSTPGPSGALSVDPPTDSVTQRRPRTRLALVAAGATLMLGVLAWWLWSGRATPTNGTSPPSTARAGNASPTTATPTAATPTTATPTPTTATPTPTPTTATPTTATPTTATPTTATPPTATPTTATPPTATPTTATPMTATPTTASPTPATPTPTTASPTTAAKTPTPTKPGRVDPLRARLTRVRYAWVEVREGRPPAERRIFDLTLDQVEKSLSSGARADATEALNAFVRDALRGREP